MAKRSKAKTDKGANAKAAEVTKDVAEPSAENDWINVRYFNAQAFHEPGVKLRRKAWGNDVFLVAGDTGGRGGRKPTIMISGHRAGLLPWKPKNHDDLLADDWQVLLPVDADLSEPAPA